MTVTLWINVRATPLFHSPSKWARHLPSWNDEGQGYMYKEAEIERERRKQPSGAEIVVSVLTFIRISPSLDINSFDGYKLLLVKGQTRSPFKNTNK